MGPDLRHTFSELDAPHGAIVALSGGSDSLSLLLLARQIFHDRKLPLQAVTVDHQLRRESAAEAEMVGSLCARYGITHRTMVWEGAKPASGISEAAREARYQLLAQAAEEAGTNIILVGHTLDDQAETVAMRLRRGEGTGLSGMAPATLYRERFWIVRPLLNERRNRLRAYLEGLGVSWIDDPSNESDAYERVRTRRLLDKDAVAGLVSRAAAEARARRLLMETAAGLVARFISMPFPGVFRLLPDLLEQEERAAILTLRACLATAGGTPRFPELPAARNIFERLATGKNVRATLSRAIIDQRRDAIFIYRENRNLSDLLVDRDEIIWDGRWRVRGAAGGTITPSHLMLDETPSSGDVPGSIARSAGKTMPFLSGHKGDATGAITLQPVIAPYSRFLPEFDLQLALALGRLTGAAKFPPLPWKQQIEPQPLTERGESAWQGPAPSLC